jgi:hypothetical protein
MSLQRSPYKLTHVVLVQALKKLERLLPPLASAKVLQDGPEHNVHVLSCTTQTLGHGMDLTSSDFQDISLAEARDDFGRGDSR